MTRIILSLWLPHLPTDRLAWQANQRAPWQAPPPSPGTPAAGDPSPIEPGRVTVATVRNAQRVAAADGRARAAGIQPGMTLADARAIQPALRVHPAEPDADAAWLDDIAAWCGRFTPLVAIDGTDGLVLDMSGATHLFGGAAATAATIEERLRALGVEARAAVAATPEAAWALARFGQDRVSPAQADEPAFRHLFGALPLAALRLDAETVRALGQAGLRVIGDLLCRPRAPLVARFGVALSVRLDGLMGQAQTPISPRFEPPCFVADHRFASPIALEADIVRTLAALAHHVCALMERQAKGARRIEARLFRVDGAVKRLTVGTSRPLVKAQDLLRLFGERIAALGEDGLDTGYGFDVVRLGVLVADPVGRQQGDILGDGAAHGDAADLATLVDRLGARLGGRAVTHLAARQSHIPERAAASLPVTDRRAPPRRAGVAPVDPPGDAPARPIRLFDRPEQIDTVAAVPDGPPVRFQWRRATYVVAAIEGPERIAPEWWKSQNGPSLTRDYFRAEDREGRQFWLFREGLFNAETPAPRWFVHGLFG